MKKLTAVLLMMALMCCFSANAVQTTEEPVPEVLSSASNVTELPKPVFVPITEDDDLITPYKSEVPVKNEAITRHGLEWYQREGYPAYRIWVQNDTDAEMKVTIGYEGVTEDNKMVFRVAPHSGGGGYVNFAIEGIVYYVDFQTKTGDLAGTCTVRISTEPLE